MESKGIVKAINGSEIILKMYKETACQHCSACDNDHKFARDFKITSDKVINIGDIITLEMETKDMTKAAFLAYLFPAVSMIVGYCIANYLLHLSENKSIIASFAAIVVSFVLLNIYDRAFRKKHKDFNIKIISIEKSV